MTIYKDINGKELFHGDEILTIEKNLNAKGGNLVKAYFKINMDGKGMIVKDMSNNSSSSFYKKSFDKKVYKI